MTAPAIAPPRTTQCWATADQWIQDVAAGVERTNQMVRKACERHLRDLDNDRGLWFDEAAANKAIGLFPFLKQRKGRWAAQPLTLEPCQLFIVGSLFGWKRADGTRRFRVGYVEVPRKFGKTTLAAGIADYLAFFDGEPGSEVYCTATKKDQAKICWSESHWQLSNAPAKLKAPLLIQTHNISNPLTSSKLEYLGADKDGTDGLNPHGVICDEIHAWKSEEFLGKLETATGAREQPMRFMITTAGTQTSTLYLTEHRYAAAVLTGTYEDDSVFVFISCADDPEKWGDEEQWCLANPNVGVTVSLDTLRDEYRKARVSPSKQSMFKRMYLGIITSSAESWLTAETLDAQAPGGGIENIEDGRPFTGGLDLSSIRDITAFLQWFQDDDGDGGEIIARFYMPELNLQARVDEDQVPYDVWAREGYITLTPGATVDYEFIIRDILDASETHQALTFGIDPWNGVQVRTAIENAGLTIVKVPQSHIRLDSCVAEAERLLSIGRVRGFQNPVLRWMFLNAVVNMNAQKLRKLDKLSSPEKIDGAVAWLNALSEAMANAEESYDWVVG